MLRTTNNSYTIYRDHYNSTPFELLISKDKSKGVIKHNSTIHAKVILPQWKMRGQCVFLVSATEQ